MVDNSDLNEALRSITAKPKHKPRKATGEILVLCFCYFLFILMIGAAFAKWLL